MAQGLKKMSASSTDSTHMVAEIGMAEGMGEQPVDLSAEERKLLSVAHTSAIGSRRGAWRIITSVKQKEIYDDILALMDENLIPSACTGEPKAFYFEKKDNYYRFLAECATGDAKSKAGDDVCVARAEGTREQKTVEVPQVVYIDKAVDVPMMSEKQAPMIQKVLKTVEAPQVQYSVRIVDLPVATQCRVPTIQPVQETVDMPQVQFLDQVRGRIIEETDVPIPRVMEETIEVEKPKSQRFTLLADNKLAPKLDDGCAVQAPDWEELQRLRDEGSMTVHDTNKLPNDSHNLELFKETLPSPIMMQVQQERSLPRETHQGYHAVSEKSSP